MSDIVLDLPVPPSVNRTRRIDWAGHVKFKRWRDTADQLVLAARSHGRIPGPVFIYITLSESHTRIDLDNGLKWLLDYLKRIEVIEDDRQSIVRKVILEWGFAPEGCRVEVVPAS